MSGPVGVLAWVDAKVQREREAMWATGLPNKQLDEVVRIRAAVAELIEANKELARIYGPLCCSMRIGTERRNAWQRMFAALANVGSAS